MVCNKELAQSCQKLGYFRKWSGSKDEVIASTIIWLPGGAAGVSSGVTGWYNGFITEIGNQKAVNSGTVTFWQNVDFLISNTCSNLRLYGTIIFEHCKYLNARSECNDIVISVYRHYPLDPNAKSSDTKGQLISKSFIGVFNFLQKTNENKSHS